MQVNLQDTEPVRWLQSPRGLQSMRAPLVCVVMAHLENNRHGRLHKALLVCFYALLHFFPLSFNSFSPFFVQTARPLPYLSDVCPIDLFVSAPLMVPSFGGFVSLPPVIAILCETKERERERKKRGIKMSLRMVLMMRLPEGVHVCVCVCFVVGSIVGPWECSLPTCSRWGISGKLV